MVVRSLVEYHLKIVMCMKKRKTRGEIIHSRLLQEHLKTMATACHDFPVQEVIACQFSRSIKTILRPLTLAKLVRGLGLFKHLDSKVNDSNVAFLQYS